MLQSARIGFTDQHGFPRRLILRLDDGGSVPRFEQLRAQLAVMIAVGRLEPGCRLPTVRDLATQLGVAPGTVARAYRHLEQDDSVRGRGRLGTFVVDEPPHSEPLLERQQRLDDAARRFAAETRQLGIRTDDAIAAYRQSVTRLAAEESDRPQAP
ncbi:MAG: GntR family transcriptional regulator [Actinobacteria bacterium]|nr:GntR family transcriptional regulator [Actinomycetota bacterium]